MLADILQHQTNICSLCNFLLLLFMSKLFSEWNVHVKGKVPFLPPFSKLHFNIRQGRKQRINSTLNHEESINQQKISKTFFLSFSAERQTGRRASRKIPARRRNKKKNIKAMFVSWLSARCCVWWKILIFCYCMSKDVEGRNLIKEDKTWYMLTSCVCSAQIAHTLTTHNSHLGCRKKLFREQKLGGT